MIKLKAAALTDPGQKREINEDSVWQNVFTPPNRRPRGMFIVCDGMGGHMGGEFASYWAVEALKLEFADLMALQDPRETHQLSKKDREKAKSGELPDFITKIDIETRIRLAVEKANQVVYDYAQNKSELAGNAGTTITMAVVLDGKATITNVGDSRTYLLRRHELRQITVDHSLVAKMVERGEISPDEIYTHPQRNVIYRFLGQKEVDPSDVFTLDIKKGDRLLLCSDGLWEMVQSNQKIIDILEKAKSPEKACQELIQEANHAGGEDNISVVVVQAY